MHSLNSLSTFGTHPKDFDPEQVKPVLVNLDIVIKWYLKYKETGIDIKTKPAEAIRQKVKSTGDTKKNITISRKKLAGLLSGLVAIIVTAFAVLFFAKIIGGGKQIKEPEKSIAVLPFINDSPDTTNAYFINGLMDKITTNLQMIKELRVVSRTSVEQYRNRTKSIPEIAKELDVNYIVEGNGQKYGSSFSVDVKLIKARGKETHLWSKPYEQEIKEVNDYIKIQSQIAQAIAEELKAVITPEEKQRIEKTPTGSLTAYNFYQRGTEELKKFGNDYSNRTALLKAEDFFYKALKYDSTFALAYVGLASVYWNKNYYKQYFSGNFLDSVPIFANKALLYDDQLSEAYTIKGNYYNEIGKTELASKEFDKAIKFNPNDWKAYFGKGDIESLQIAASLNHGSELPVIIGSLVNSYTDAGFIEIANKNLEYQKLIGEPIQYYYNAAYCEHKQGHWEKAIEYSKKEYDIDSTNTDALEMLGYCYSFIGQFEESLKYYRKYVARLKASDQLALSFSHRIGYTYFKNGYKKEAGYYFDQQIDYCNGQIKLKRPWALELYPYYDLAGVYAFRGDKVKAYMNLKIYNQRQEPEGLWMVSLIKTDPLFDSIRNEPEFQQIVRDVETRYQAEHERVKKWLEEQGML
jgi:TolB-like protein